MKVALISCVSKKLDRPARAQDFYISPLFRGSLRYAQDLGAEKILVLSAKYGLVDLEKVIELYDETLKTMNVAARKAWTEAVLRDLRLASDLRMDHFILLAGEVYRKFIVPELASYEVPLAGFGIGRQLSFYASRRVE